MDALLFLFQVVCPVLFSVPLLRHGRGTYLHITPEARRHCCQALEDLFWAAIATLDYDSAIPTLNKLQEQARTREAAARDTQGFGSHQYRAVSAIAHAAPHAIGLVGDGSDPLTARDIAQRHLPMLGAFGLAALMLCDRMGWDNHVLRVVYDKTLRLWLEAAEPGSSAGLIDVF